MIIFHLLSLPRAYIRCFQT